MKNSSKASSSCDSYSTPQGVEFDYDLAFSRNLGWITKEEQNILKNKTVAIAGLGGVGGTHLLTLVRMGLTRFHIADFDTFGIENFNRQVGSNISTVGETKIEIMTRDAKLINPDVQITQFPNGINTDNIHEFLKNVDVYVDGLDAFAFDARCLVFNACEERKIPAVTVAPIGMGAALLNFMPGQMSFKDYFGLESAKDETQKVARFILGLTPSSLQMKSIADMSFFKLGDHKGPSTSMGCSLSTGVLGTEVTKILLKRGHVIAAPHGLHFDAFSNRYKKTWIPFGFRNPLMRLKVFLFTHLYVKKKEFVQMNAALTAKLNNG